jgi:hypothetical protein
MGEAKRVYQARDGVVRTAIIDPDRPNDLTVLTQMDVEPVLDSIHRDRELMRHGVNKLVARLPLFIVEDLIRREIYTDEPKFKKWLNSPEAQVWRIWRGEV